MSAVRYPTGRERALRAQQTYPLVPIVGERQGKRLMVVLACSHEVPKHSGGPCGRTARRCPDCPRRTREEA
jgi:hypothetical protein